MTNHLPPQHTPWHLGEQFALQTIDLSEAQYMDCTFHDCTILYDAAGPVYLQGCTFHDCRWGFAGAAAETLTFLRDVLMPIGLERMILNSIGVDIDNILHTGPEIIDRVSRLKPGDVFSFRVYPNYSPSFEASADAGGWVLTIRDQAGVLAISVPVPGTNSFLRTNDAAGRVEVHCVEDDRRRNPLDGA